MSMLLAGCVRGKKETCSYFVKMLNSPEDRPEALKNIQSLACLHAIPKLPPIFKTGSNQVDIIRTVNQVVTKGRSLLDSKRNELDRAKDDTTKDRLKQELQFAQKAYAVAQSQGSALLVEGLTVPDISSLCAATIKEWDDNSVFKDWGRSKAATVLAKIAGDKTFKQSRAQAVQALATIAPADKTYESLYIKLTQKDPNAQEMDVFVTSLEQLGEMKSQEGLEQIIRGLFIKNQKKEASAGAARVALGKIGKPAAAAVIATLNGENTAFQEWCLRQGIPEWRWKFGPELLIPLGDLRMASGAQAIMKNLATPFPDANTIPEAQQGSYVQSVTNRLKIGAMSLANIGDDSILNDAQKLALDKEQHYGLRIDLVWGMAMMGTENCRKTLFNIYNKAERDEFKEQVVRFIALSMKPEDNSKFERIVRASSKYPFVQKRLETDAVVNHLAVVKECSEKGDDCILAVLKPLDLDDKEDMDSSEKAKAASHHMFKQEKAALWLSHLPKNNDKYFAPLMQAFRDAKVVDQDLKRYLFIAITKHATKGDLKALAELHEEIENVRRLGLIAWDLKMFNIYLAR
jgi:hypothetical protein